jgi:hypothetical protein
MDPHEAAQEEVWSYLTCCWLLDVAVWRFRRDAPMERFIGHLNRNAFRRLWWRREILGDLDLTLLGEDELVNIMERPTLFSNRRLARDIARELLDRVQRDGVPDRMRLMREATKRILRLTPFVAMSSLDDAQLRLLVSDGFDAASAGLAGQPSVMATRVARAAREASPEVVGIPTLSVVTASEASLSTTERADRLGSFDELAEAALDIARRTGRVTNGALREVVPITSEEGREVFRELMERGQLVRRGVKRGTHYVLPDAQIASSDAAVSPEPERAAREEESTQIVAAVARGRPSDTALRRLLQRRR